MRYRKPNKLLLSLALLSLTSCAANTTETVRTVHDYCLLAKGITYAEQHDGDTEDATNKYDTAITVQEVKDADLVFEKICSAEKTPQNK